MARHTLAGLMRGLTLESATYPGMANVTDNDSNAPQRKKGTGCAHESFTADARGTERCDGCNQTRKRLEALRMGRELKRATNAEKRALRRGVDRTAKAPGPSIGERPGAPSVSVTPHAKDRPQRPTGPTDPQPTDPADRQTPAAPVEPAPDRQQRMSVISALKLAIGLRDDRQ